MIRATLLTNLRGLTEKAKNGYNCACEKRKGTCSMKHKMLSLILAAAVIIYALLPGGAGAVGLSYTPTAQYMASVYYQRLRNAKLTGDRAFDIINIAATQLGYHEGNEASELGGGNKRGTGNYSEYGYWFGTQVMGSESGLFTAWCAFFVSWCARQAGISEYVVCNAAYAKPDGASSRGFGYFHVDAIEPGGYTPRYGDLIFIDWDADKTWDHVGLVYYSAGGKVGTIEGNAEDGVRHREYDLDDPVIRAYGSPAYGERSGAAERVLKAEGIADMAVRNCFFTAESLLFPGK